MARGYGRLASFGNRWAAAVLCLLPLVVFTAGAQTVSVYPQGAVFPLELYSLQPTSDTPLVTPNGWNIGHQYGWNQVTDPPTGESSLNSLMQSFALNGIEGLPHLPAFQDSSLVSSEWSEVMMASWIQAIDPNSNIAYWDLPEEQRYFKPTEFQLVKDYTAWTRKYDPQQRPNYMYIPTHFTQDQVSNYVPYLDIIPASAYADFAGHPHAWVRWRMEETIRGIQLANAIIGKDYLHGQKTPVGVVQLFVGTNGIIPTADQTRHDFWQLIASGAQGIFVFSYFHRNDQSGALLPNWNALQQAASQLSGSEKLGDMVLYGQPVSNVMVTVTSGPTQTVSFIPTGYTTPFQFPSIHLLAKQWNGKTYIIAVNSTDQTVTANIANLPPSVLNSAAVLFESRSVPISSSSFTDSFPAWGVHIYAYTNPIATTTAIASSGNPSTAGQSVTFTATVTPANVAGSVQFQDGNTPLSSVTLSNGSASFPTSSLTVGPHNITATFTPTGSTFLSSTSPILTQVVMTGGTGHTTTTAFSNPPAVIYFHQRAPVVFSVGVTGSTTPSGNVVLLDGNTLLGQTPLDMNGNASYAPPANSPLQRVGKHNIQAVYLGNGSFDGSAASVTVNVSPRPKPR